MLRKFWDRLKEGWSVQPIISPETKKMLSDLSKEELAKLIDCLEKHTPNFSVVGESGTEYLISKS